VKVEGEMDVGLSATRVGLRFIVADDKVRGRGPNRRRRWWVHFEDDYFLI
jgi:hypothetical protein